MDIEKYIISRYNGEGRLQRLHSVATYPETPPPIKEQALVHAIQYAQDRGNIQRYNEFVALLESLNSSAVSADVAWLKKQGETNRHENAQLRQRLQIANSHLNKDAMRQAHLATSEYCTRVGDLQDACQASLRAKDFCLNRSDVAEVSLSIIQLAIYMKTHTTLQEYTLKLSNSTRTDDPLIRYKQDVAAGIERLVARDYNAARKRFTSAVLMSEIQNGDEAAHHSDLSWREVLAPEDVSLFAGILSLAFGSTTEQEELADHAEALASVPMIRETVVQVTKNADFKQAWSLLDQHAFRPLAADICIGSHLPAIKQQIQERFVLQYWRPYKCVSLKDMADRLGPDILPESQVESIWTTLIKKSARDTRIDIRRGLLIRSTPNKDEDRLVKTEEKLRKVSHKAMDNVYCSIIRSACIEKGLAVPPSRRKRGGAGDVFGGQVLGSMYDSEEEMHMMDVDMSPEDAVAFIDEANPEDVY